MLLVLATLWLTLFAVVQVGQRIARRRAERLLADIRSLQLEKSTWTDAHAVMQRWGKWGHYDGTCDANSCEYRIRFEDWTFDSIERLTDGDVRKDFLWIPLELTVFLLDAQLPEVEGSISVTNSIVTHDGFSLLTAITPFGGTKSRTSQTLHPERLYLWPEPDPHPDYTLMVRSGTSGYFFTEFTPAAKPEDVKWLTDFDFSCITRLVPCGKMGDLLPAAWARYKVEREHTSAVEERIAECGYSLAELAKASENAVLVEVGKPDANAPEFEYPARLVERLKGSRSWKPGDVRRLWWGYASDPAAGTYKVSENDGRERNPPLPPRHSTPTEIVLFADEREPINPHDCGVIPGTPENLRAVKAALAEATPSR